MSLFAANPSPVSAASIPDNEPLLRHWFIDSATQRYSAGGLTLNLSGNEGTQSINLSLTRYTVHTRRPDQVLSFILGVTLNGKQVTQQMYPGISYKLQTAYLGRAVDGTLIDKARKWLGPCPRCL